MRLEVLNLEYAYNKEKKILDDISFRLTEGEVLSLLGPNGTGKTTLLKCVNRLNSDFLGKILIEGQDITKLPAVEIAKLIAYVPQYTSAVFPISVVDTIMMGRTPYAGRKFTQQDYDIAFQVIEMMELEEFAFRNINEMSGGERQRVFIARALAQEPKIIIMDEPTSSLDLKNQLFILNLINKIAKERQTSVLMTIHDLNLAAMFSDKIMMIKNAKLFAYGESKDVLNEANILALYGVHTTVTVEQEETYVKLRRY